MKVLFFGLGSIGQRHAKLLSESGQHDIFAFRTSDCSPAFAVKEIHNWRQVEELRPDVAFITNPTSLHLETAERLAGLGVNLFIEKPLDLNDEKLSAVVSKANEKNLVTYVAYNLRFHPVVEKLRELSEKQRPFYVKATSSSYLPTWRPGQDHRQSYSSHAHMGGGVILDLSHEIDYVSWIMGGTKSLKGIAGRVSGVTVDSEDYADIEMTTVSGSAHIHLDYFSQRCSRDVMVHFPGFTAYGDLLLSTLDIYIRGKKEESFKFEYDRDSTYRKQLSYFFSNLNNPSMMNNINEASELFRKFVSFRKEIL